MNLKFTTDIVVCDTAYKGGDVVPESAVPAGYVARLVKLGQVTRAAPTDAPAKPAEPTDPTPQPAAKKASK